MNLTTRRGGIEKTPSCPSTLARITPSRFPTFRPAPILLVWLLAACASTQPLPSQGPLSTALPSPTATPILPSPSDTPTPTATLSPSPSTTPPPLTATPRPSETPAPTATPNFILWDEASQHLGEETTVCGPVMDAHYASTSNGKPTFLNLGEKYPNPARFTIVIWGRDRQLFTPSPEALYQDHTICVTGKIEEYKGSFEIIVSDPTQIEIHDE